MIFRFSALLAIMLLVAACHSDPPELKSPCVGIEGSPCGDRHPVNEEWLREYRS